ncbi:hypothetical protein RHS01_02550 [Rhizoctonia solani]|uniref:Uncharacterized protein n=1 Tax=Rhizoctonia solani TaxID=456999 RepID=A0A8H7IHN5_9AGAM|nr:hypothetical protein RHS01_02550 [Rhizoctonia solani]
MPDSTNNKHTPHPLANEESFEMDELNENSAPPSDKEEIMPKAVLEGEADDLSTWAWISAIWCVLTYYYTKAPLNDIIKVAGERGTDTLGTILIHPIRDWPPCSLLYSVTSIPSHHPADAIKEYGGSQNHPLLIPLTCGFTLVAFLSYNKPVEEVGSLGFLVFIGNGFCALYGSYLLLFNGPTLRSKKTGADKHTSAFLFGNKNAASVQKKKWRKERGK